MTSNSMKYIVYADKNKGCASYWLTLLVNAQTVDDAISIGKAYCNKEYSWVGFNNISAEVVDETQGSVVELSFDEYER